MNRQLALSGQIPAKTDDVIVAVAPRLLGLEVAALVYGVSADTITALQESGEWPVVRIGNRRLVPVAAVDAWIERQTAARECPTCTGVALKPGRTQCAGCRAEGWVA